MTPLKEKLSILKPGRSLRSYKYTMGRWVRVAWVRVAWMRVMWVRMMWVKMGWRSSMVGSDGKAAGDSCASFAGEGG